MAPLGKANGSLIHPEAVVKMKTGHRGEHPNSYVHILSAYILESIHKVYRSFHLVYIYLHLLGLISSGLYKKSRLLRSSPPALTKTGCWLLSTMRWSHICLVESSTLRRYASSVCCLPCWLRPRWRCSRSPASWRLRSKVGGWATKAMERKAPQIWGCITASAPQNRPILIYKHFMFLWTKFIVIVNDPDVIFSWCGHHCFVSFRLSHSYPPFIWNPPCILVAIFWHCRTSSCAIGVGLGYIGCPIGGGMGWVTGNFWSWISSMKV